MGSAGLRPSSRGFGFLGRESYAKLLPAGNREPLRGIAEKAPGPLNQLAQLTGRKESIFWASVEDHGALRAGAREAGQSCG